MKHPSTLFTALVLLVSLGLVPLGLRAGQDEHDHGKEEEPHAVTLTEEQMERLGIETAVAWAGTLDTSIEVPGRLVLDPSAVAHVVPRVTGIVREVPRRIGDAIKVGDPLAVLESSELAEARAVHLAKLQQKALADLDLARAQILAANTKKMLEIFQGAPNMAAIRTLAPLDLGANRGTLVSAYAEMASAEARFQREKNLRQKNLTSEAEYQEAQTGTEKASATFLSTREDLTFSNRRMLEERQRAQALAAIELRVVERKLQSMGLPKDEIPKDEGAADLDLARHVVTSPRDGILLEQHLVQGEVFSGGSAPFTVADLRTVWALLTVYPRDLPKIRAGQEVEVVLSDGTLRREGKLDWVSPVVDERSHTASARVVLSNEDGRLMPGLFISGRIRVQKEKIPLLVPRVALQTVENELVVFIRTEEGFEPRPVTTGRSNSTHVEILRGLAPGDTIAAQGAFSVKAELAKGEAEHDH